MARDLSDRNGETQGADYRPGIDSRILPQTDWLAS
jgi:hypothetical protein